MSFALQIKFTTKRQKHLTAKELRLIDVDVFDVLFVATLIHDKAVAHHDYGIATEDIAHVGAHVASGRLARFEGGHLDDFVVVQTDLDFVDDVVRQVALADDYRRLERICQCFQFATLFGSYHFLLLILYKGASARLPQHNLTLTSRTTYITTATSVTL